MNFVIGMAAGAFGGLLGLGGGMIIIPFLVKFAGLSQHKAHGTSLVSLVFTACAGSFPYLWHGNIDVMAAVILAGAAVFTAGLGATCCHLFSEERLKRTFGIFLIVMALLIIVKSFLPPLAHPATGIAKWVLLVGVGLATGFLSGLLGIGGGVVMVLFMVLILGYEQPLAQGTSLLAMIPGGAVGGWTHWKQGTVVREHLFGLISGIVIGAMAGGVVAQHMPAIALRIAFVTFLLWIGYRYTTSTSAPSP